MIGHVKKIFSLIYIKKAILFFKKTGARASFDRILLELQISDKKSLNKPLKNINFYQYEEIIILTTKHCMYIAEIICKSFEKININSRIINECPKEGYKKVPHIVICPQMFAKLPDLFIAFQMEQSVNSRWFTEKYFNILKNAYAIFDYSLNNVEFLQKKDFYLKQIYYMPIDYFKYNDLKEKNQKKYYDVIFYGDINNDRRKRYIDKIGEHFSVKVISNLFGEELKKEIKRAKVLINIHYYEDALLETTRIFECLSLNSCVIVSERSSDSSENMNLENIVDFVDIDDVNAMIDRIEFWLKDDKRRNEKIDLNKYFLDNKGNLFEFYFYRFLLATDNISFEEFYDLAGNNIKFNSNKICLGLPESAERKKAFDNDNTFGFEYFPGLRSSIGWVGCGLSYKFIMRKAMEQKFENIAVCEDDVLFVEDFEERFIRISKYLNEHKNEWDLFLGLAADLSNVNIKGINKLNEDEDLVYIDKMVSTVFNIYNQSIYQYLLRWDENNIDIETNTIDRFLNKQKSPKILIANPFLVGHNEDYFSTLWGFQNKAYSDLIEKSSVLLREKINDYYQNKF